MIPRLQAVIDLGSETGPLRILDTMHWLQEARAFSFLQVLVALRWAFLLLLFRLELLLLLGGNALYFYFSPSMPSHESAGAPSRGTPQVGETYREA
jgi:hypothetical protein